MVNGRIVNCYGNQQQQQQPRNSNEYKAIHHEIDLSFVEMNDVRHSQ